MPEEKQDYHFMENVCEKINEKLKNNNLNECCNNDTTIISSSSKVASAATVINLNNNFIYHRSSHINVCEGSMTSNSNTIDSRACTRPEKKIWFRGIRPSKFRHVYGVPSRKEACYNDISIVRNGNDGNICAVNPKFLAIVADSSFAVININQTGRIDFQCYKVIGHNGLITDLKWNPFDDNMIASASDDCTVKIWQIPEDGLTSNLDEYAVELCAHKRKVIQIEWHPTANNVLFTIGFDHLILLWDISRPNEVLRTINCHSDTIFSMAINRDGSLIATTSRDKKLRVIEPRSGIIVSEGVCHLSTKCTKVTFLDNGRVLTTGFSRHSDRQYAIWDQHDVKKPLVQEVIDSSSGVLIPFFDYDTKMLYLAGKGDGNIRYYEIVDEAPYIYYLNQYLSGQPQKSLGFMPKRGLNVQHCEIYRFYKIYAVGNVCEPISMVVPRKSTLFQNDLYPDTASNIPAISAKEWLTGRNVQPILMSMETGIKLAQNSNKGINNNITDNKLINSKYNNGMEKEKINNKKLDNNSRKFAFLAQQTVPDYRPQAHINEKSQKTSTNQSTKFHQLQALFGHQTANIKEITNFQNNLISSNSKNNSRNSSLENITSMNSENELRKAFTKQSEEIKNLRNQLALSEKRVRELELEIKQLQNFK